MTAQRSSEKLANLVWELTEDSEESAQTGEVTMTLTKAQAQELYGLFWRLGGKYQRGLYECGWKPPKKGKKS